MEVQSVRPVNVLLLAGLGPTSARMSAVCVLGQVGGCCLICGLINCTAWDSGTHSRYASPFVPRLEAFIFLLV